MAWLHYVDEKQWLCYWPPMLVPGWSFICRRSTTYRGTRRRREDDRITVNALFRLGLEPFLESFTMVTRWRNPFAHRGKKWLWNNWPWVSRSLSLSRFLSLSLSLHFAPIVGNFHSNPDERSDYEIWGFERWIKQIYSVNVGLLETYFGPVKVVFDVDT